MRSRISMSVLPALLVLLLSTGCAGSRTASNAPVAGAGSSTMRVVGVPPIGSLTIYLINDVGARRLVGYVRPGQDAELRFDIPAVGTYYFLAQTVGRESGASNAVRLQPGMSVRWDLTTNIALIDER